MNFGTKQNTATLRFDYVPNKLLSTVIESMMLCAPHVFLSTLVYLK